MKKILVAATTAAMLFSLVHAESTSHANASQEKHWDYAKNGPTHWGEFSKTCSEGRAQSPINILPGKSVTIDPKDVIRLDDDVDSVATVIDNGHSIKVTPKKGGRTIFRGEPYHLLQFHFHGKSEHTVNSKRYDMVAHYVHKNLNTGDLLVVAVFFEEGKNNPTLDTIINNVGKEITISPRDLAPKERKHFYHYVGSLTTPPCSENVQWFLLKNPAQASKEQIAAFRKYYVDNKRPIQELNDRKVEAY
ncbi:MAG: carbonic anhydrase family protein [Campylobacterota bacterium]|nr:carbonic anhydrase family protein [Campylobacterota bacterium]